MAFTYPFKKYNYLVEIEGITVAGFSEVSGFDANIDVIEYREGSDTINSPRKLPGLTKYGNVTLKWGMTDDVTFYEWVSQISRGEATGEDRLKTVTINLQNDAHDTIATWTLNNAWPCKYVAPDFNASASEVAFESVEMAFEELLRGESGGNTETTE